MIARGHGGRLPATDRTRSPDDRCPEDFPGSYSSRTASSQHAPCIAGKARMMWHDPCNQIDALRGRCDPVVCNITRPQDVMEEATRRLEVSSGTTDQLSGENGEGSGPTPKSAEEGIVSPVDPSPRPQLARISGPIRAQVQCSSPRTRGVNHDRSRWLWEGPCLL